MRSQDILIKYAELNPLRYRDSVSQKTWEKILSRTLFYFTKNTDMSQTKTIQFSSIN